MILYANAPHFYPGKPITGWLRGTLVAKPGSVDQFAVVKPNGKHVAFEPYGIYGERPAGSFGAYETVRVRGTNLVVQYEFNGEPVDYVIPFVGDL